MQHRHHAQYGDAPSRIHFNVLSEGTGISEELACMIMKNNAKHDTLIHNLCQRTKHIYHNITGISYNIKEQRFLTVRETTFGTEVGEEG
jgi:hypothetical protein